MRIALLVAMMRSNQVNTQSTSPGQRMVGLCAMAVFIYSQVDVSGHQEPEAARPSPLLYHSTLSEENKREEPSPILHRVIELQRVEPV